MKGKPTQPKAPERQRNMPKDKKEKHDIIRRALSHEAPPIEVGSEEQADDT